MIDFNNTYIDLPIDFYQSSKPSAAVDPKLIAFNLAFANDLGLDQRGLDSTVLADYFSGRKLPLGAKPVATVYAGHQFGHFNPRLGDGRAVLLGEFLDLKNRRYDLQLKGSGPTVFSRGGDGFSSLGPVLREYIVSEAMAYLGVPTTRALAAVTTGGAVFRQDKLPGAILARVASSHLRIGTFEYFAARHESKNLKILADYAIKRHFSHCIDPSDRYLSLLRLVAKKQLKLVAKWMGLGFIHGVMNTDNSSICGETIDYGPCAFMDHFKKDKVYSFIDKNERYAFSNQPKIALWNISCLANALFSLLIRKGESEAACIQRLQKEFDNFSTFFDQEYLSVMTRKFGIFEGKKEDLILVQNFLHGLEESHLDFTNSFRSLSEETWSDHDFCMQWHKRIKQQPQTKQEVSQLMLSCNPYLIPRNHQIEKAIQDGLMGNFQLFHRLNKAFLNPYFTNAEFADLTKPPQPWEEVTNTFCGT